MVSVILVSVWAGGATLKSSAMLNPATGEILNVVPLNDLPDQETMIELETEHLVFDGREYDIEHDEEHQRSFVLEDSLQDLQANLAG